MLIHASMKKVITKGLAALCALGGLLLIPTLLYNACGIAGSQDCADGSGWVSLIIVVAILGLFIFSYWLFRRGQ